MEVKPLGPDHAYVGLVAFVVTDNCIELATPHPNTPPVAETVGGVVLPVITIVSVETQELPPAEAETLRI